MKVILKKELNRNPFYYKFGIVFRIFAPAIPFLSGLHNPGYGNFNTREDTPHCFVDNYPLYSKEGFFSSNMKEENLESNYLCSNFGSMQSSSERSFHDLMVNIGDALNVSISVHDLPSLLNRIQYDDSEDFLQNFPCLSLCDYLDRPDTYTFYELYQFWKDFSMGRTNNSSNNITDQLLNQKETIWSDQTKEYLK